jgi:hypothetical protein
MVQPLVLPPLLDELYATSTSLAGITPSLLTAMGAVNGQLKIAWY